MTNRKRFCRIETSNPGSLAVTSCISTISETIHDFKSVLEVETKDVEICPNLESFIDYSLLQTIILPMPWPAKMPSEQNQSDLCLWRSRLGNGDIRTLRH